jgi:hypothetical protein
MTDNEQEPENGPTNPPEWPGVIALMLGFAVVTLLLRWLAG